MTAPLEYDDERDGCTGKAADAADSTARVGWIVALVWSAILLGILLKALWLRM